MSEWRRNRALTRLRTSGFGNVHVSLPGRPQSSNFESSERRGVNGSDSRASRPGGATRS